jgi:hypothetical protein
LKSAGKIKCERDAEEFLGGQRAALGKERISGYRGPDEAAEAVENKNGGRVHFWRWRLNKKLLDNIFGLLLQTNLEEGEHRRGGKRFRLGSWNGWESWLFLCPAVMARRCDTGIGAQVPNQLLES